MAKVRVYELARKHNINSKEILQILIDGGVKDKNHMSALEDNTVRYIENRLRERLGIKVKPPEKREQDAHRPKERRPEERPPTAAALAPTGARPSAAPTSAAAAAGAMAAGRQAGPGSQAARRPEAPGRRSVPQQAWGRAGSVPNRAAGLGAPAGPGAGRAHGQAQPFAPRGRERSHGMRTLSAQRIAAMTSGAARVPAPPKRPEPPAAAPPAQPPAAQLPPTVPAPAATAAPPVVTAATPAPEVRSQPAQPVRSRGEVAAVDARPARPETLTAAGAAARDLAVVKQPAQQIPVVRLPARPPQAGPVRDEHAARPHRAPGRGPERAGAPAPPREPGRALDRERGERPPKTAAVPGPAAQGARLPTRLPEVPRRTETQVRPVAPGRAGAAAGTGAGAGAGAALAGRRPGTGRYTGMAAKLELKPKAVPALQAGQRPALARVGQGRAAPGAAPGAPAREAKPEPQKPVLELPDRITVGALAEKLSISVSDMIKKLMALGLMVTVNQQIDFDTAAILVEDTGYEPRRESEREAREFGIVEEEDPPESLVPRPPVVTIMGHVDHGKTSLLDAIRSTNVTAQEAGGITQHIGAYQVELRGRRITFLDTPGHEAFTAMRARGAQVTDVAVLVVAADDGVMPQTVEAINHAKAAGVPIVVAINKIDKPNAQPDRVKQQLSEHGLVAEDWGGDVVMVPVSALRKQGIENVLEMILLVADMRELRANPNRPARGTVIEARLDKGRGPVATVLVQKGTLKLGDSIVVGATSGRVRAMTDDRGRAVEAAGPSTPVEVLGLSDVPQAGETMQAVPEDRVARQLADQREERRREEGLTKVKKVSLEDLFKQVSEGEIKELNVIIKADVQGSAEALRQSFEELTTPQVRVNVIHSGVGSIKKADIMLASASRAVIVGFQVRPEPVAKKMAEQEGIDVRLYDVIYDAINDLRDAMKGMLAPELKEVTLGRAEVRQTFRVPKVGVVAGAYVSEGRIVRGAEVRVLRDNAVVYSGRIESLKRFKDDVREVAEGFECGIGIEKFNDIKEGDVIEAYAMEEQPKEA